MTCGASYFRMLFRVRNLSAKCFLLKLSLWIHWPCPLGFLSEVEVLDLYESADAKWLLPTKRGSLSSVRDVEDCGSQMKILDESK